MRFPVCVCLILLLAACDQQQSIESKPPAATTTPVAAPALKPDPNWDLSGVIENIQALHAVGKRLAGESTFPQWNADSEFSAVRETAMKNAAQKH